MIKKAVILAAGRGTRFYPVSKHTSKEVVLLDTKPMIAYLLEEVATAGVSEVCLVTSLRKADLNWAFEFHAKNLGLSSFTLYQEKPLGTAGALWLVKEWIGEEAFFLYYADDLWLPDLKANPRLPSTRAEQLLAAYIRFNSPILSLMEVSLFEVSRFGVISWDCADDTGKIFAIRSIREKPKPEEAPSNLALVSGMILTPGVFEAIGGILHDRNLSAKEVFLTAALDFLAKRQPVYGCFLSGEWVDVGTLEDYPRAFVRMVRYRHEVARASRG
ncbi:hypothetical protein A2797_00300 [candidate division WWE3 bacterium RIFCSPHIGHO2_01_FULL_48_15]|uniref:UTP--glucose-1-phosphate uridylyltransferase n=1 Tax=candidate division WWE3 bacterium RIFCSPHIGHO2_01_FULL_48_15 TaxID=1802619 RepID=A0A1F4VCI4_UNCKA|nr:MAG: hypothetical protein A2797_00300 [candidate division WWE3 bacterium RIFCSPHIGHO2_01_FULL_48_15]